MASDDLTAALFQAAERGDAAEVAGLLAAGAEPNAAHTEVRGFVSGGTPIRCGVVMSA